MQRFVVDTNLYVEAIRSDEGNAALAEFQRRAAPFLHQHSTVAQEILAGARDERAFRAYHDDWVRPFEGLGRMVTPGHSAWVRAARIISRLVGSGALSPGGFTRGFLNDCLIAASARDKPFILVTRNVGDFSLIQGVAGWFEFQVPWPDR